MLITFLRVLAILLITAAAGSASAGTIDVTGSVDYDHLEGVANFIGSRGFTYSGIAPIALSRLDPAMQCIGSPALCSPGTTISLTAAAFGVDILGQATLDGVFYPNVGVGAIVCQSFPCSVLNLEFTGQVVAPPFGPSATAVVTTPVNFSTFFFHDEGQGHGLFTTEQLLGLAHATLTLRQSDCCGAPSWLYEHVRYDLEPIPEPATLLLLSTTAAGLGLARWRRRGRAE